MDKPTLNNMLLQGVQGKINRCAPLQLLSQHITQKTILKIIKKKGR